jgi:prevent-host-death family protein
MKGAKVSELKAGLSSYLAKVRAGETVIVCERTTPIARLAPLEEDLDAVQIREAAKSISELASIRPVHLRKKMDVNKLLGQIRGER